jgi:hypothetical protein
MSAGLYTKYKVTRNGKPVEGCFVLRPQTDPAARSALKRYANATENRQLASDLWEWLWEMKRQDDSAAALTPMTEAAD